MPCPAWWTSRAGAARLLPVALQGWACSGGGSPGAPARPDPAGASPGVETAHSSVLTSGLARGGRWERLPRRPAHGARHTRLPILLPACLPGSPTASPVWRREEPRLAALAAICTLRLWGWVAAPAPRSPRAMGNPRGLVAEGWGAAGGNVCPPVNICPPMRGTRQPQSSAGTAQGAGRPRVMLSGKSPLPRSAWPFWGTGVPAGARPGRNSAPLTPAHTQTWARLYLAPHRWWQLRSWKWPSALSAGRNTVSAPGRAPSSLGQRDRGEERESWGHAGTRGSLGPR